MEINRKQLKKIAHLFHSVCNRLMRSDFEDYEINLLKFIQCINSNELLYEFVLSKGQCTQDIEKAVKEVCSSYGRMIFDIGSTDEEEIVNIYAIANYIAKNQIPIRNGYAWGYCHSNKYQDMAKGFNDRFIMILIQHIDDYLTDLSIDIGLDESIVHHVNFVNGQLIIAETGSAITVSNEFNSIDEEKLAELIGNVQKQCSTLEIMELSNISDHIKELKEEVAKQKPDKTAIQRALSALSGVKGTTEFTVAVIQLTQFLQPFLQ